MTYTDKDIIALLKQGENCAIEFKGSQVHANSLAKEITAFSNSSGGVILIGLMIPPPSWDYQQIKIGKNGSPISLVTMSFPELTLCSKN